MTHASYSVGDHHATVETIFVREDNLAKPGTFVAYRVTITDLVSGKTETHVTYGENRALNWFVASLFSNEENAAGLPKIIQEMRENAIFIDFLA